MNGQDTLRSHLEAIRDDHEPMRHNAWCWRCGVGSPCPSHEHAVAALAIIDNAKCIEHFPEGWCEVSDSHPLDTCRVIPDPVPVVSPRPNQPQETPNG